MASFAKIDSENIVTTVVSVVNEVIKDSSGIEQEYIGIQFLKTLYNEPMLFGNKHHIIQLEEFIN